MGRLKKTLNQNRIVIGRRCEVYQKSGNECQIKVKLKLVSSITQHSGRIQFAVTYRAPKVFNQRNIYCPIVISTTYECYRKLTV